MVKLSALIRPAAKCSSLQSRVFPLLSAGYWRTGESAVDFDAGEAFEVQKFRRSPGGPTSSVRSHFEAVKAHGMI